MIPTVNKKLRVSHYAQVPCEPFIVEVSTEKEAYLLSEALANQHLFLYEKKIIPDYCNEVLVEMYSDDVDGDGNGGWEDYYNHEEDLDWTDYVLTYFNPEIV